MDALKLFRVMCLLQGWSGWPPRGSVVFVPGRAQGDWEAHQKGEGLLERAADIYKNTPYYRLSAVVIPGHDGSYRDGERVATGYPGFEAWKTALQKLDVHAEAVVSCVVREGYEKITHTREETGGFVLRAKERGWTYAVVLAHPHQLPRVFGCLLRSFEEIGYYLTAVPAIPESVSWLRPVYGSLGAEQLSRYAHIDEELKRIAQYVENGWMAPLDQIRNYLLKHTA